jgi:hypothetical protein
VTGLLGNALVKTPQLVEVVRERTKAVVEVLASDRARGLVERREDVVEVEVVPCPGVDTTASAEAVVDRYGVDVGQWGGSPGAITG